MQGVYIGASQSMFSPCRADPVVGRKITTSGGGFRSGDRFAFGGRECCRGFVIRPGEPQHDAGDVVLRVLG